jgi:hypothetical protein
MRTRRPWLGRFASALAGAAVAMVVTTSLAPLSLADPTDNLRTKVEAARGGCPPLRQDPILDNVARRADNETRAYTEHTARFEPFEDALPVLHEIGYKAGKAKLLAAYAHDVPTAIHGAILFGWEAIPDCTYTSFGADILDNTKSAGYVLAAVILAGT